MPRSFLFAAALSETWGEVLVALRIADQLHGAGHRVVFIAPEAMRLLFAGKPYRHGWIDRAADHLATALPEIARQEGCDAVVLVDCALIYMQLACTHQAARFVDRFDVPVVALDMWDLPVTDMTWDLGDSSWRHSPHALDPQRRVVPAPLASPGRSEPGTFAALFPPAHPPGASVRAELGAAEGEPLVLMATASWQSASSQRRPYAGRIAALFPRWIAALVAGIDEPRLRLVHVGPEPMPPLQAALGERYRHLEPVPPARFADLVGTADLLLSFNASATSIGLAIAVGTPVLLGELTRSGTAETLVAELATPSPALVDWLRQAGELHPFRVWPLGYRSFLEPVLAGNPYLDAVCSVDVLDEPGFHRAARGLLAPGPAREALIARQRDYAAAIASLPSGATAILELLD